MESSFDFAVIGAGVTALTFARLVSPSPTLLIEKSRGIGGRVATRRLGDFWVNHGPSNIEVTEPLLKELLNDAPLGLFNVNEGVYEAIRPINTWTKGLAGDFDIIRECKVDHFTKSIKGYELFDDKKKHICFAKNITICTPAPQAKEILLKSSLDGSFLDSVRYESCVQFMALLKIEIRDEDSKNNFYNLKMKSCPKIGFYLYHFEVKDEFKSLFLELEKEEITTRFMQALKLDQATVIDTHAHKWRYSTVKESLDSKFQLIHKEKNVWLAGDYFFGNDLNAAVTSAKALLRHVNA